MNNSQKQAIQKVIDRIHEVDDPVLFDITKTLRAVLADKSEEKIAVYVYDRNPTEEKAYHVWVKFPADKDPVPETAYWFEDKWIITYAGHDVAKVICWLDESGEAGKLPEQQPCAFLLELRQKSVARAIECFRTYKNVPVTFWTTALAGEVGELCNMIKKIERVDHGGIDAGSSYRAADINSEMLKEEIGGIFIYLDLLASLYNINLAEAVTETFNSKSHKYGFSYFIGEPATSEGGNP